jgi:hypothetical protein
MPKADILKQQLINFEKKTVLIPKDHQGKRSRFYLILILVSRKNHENNLASNHETWDILISIC